MHTLIVTGFSVVHPVIIIIKKGQSLLLQTNIISKGLFTFSGRGNLLNAWAFLYF